MSGLIYSGFNSAQRLQQGIGWLQQGALNEAWQAFSEVIAAEPGNAAAYQMRGVLLMRAGEHAQGLSELRRAVALQPKDPSGYINLANALRDTGAYDEALQTIDHAGRLDPNHLEVEMSRGAILMDLGRPAEALAIYDRVIERGADARAHNNRGNALNQLNRHGEATASFEQAIALAPDIAEIRVNGGYAHLATGNYERGWELFEARWKSRILGDYLAHRNFGVPFWRGGEPVEGKTILLHSEQGFGDILQFSRYARLLKARGARVVLEVEAPLVGLMARLDGVDQVVEHGRPLPPSDLHCPVMSLPFAFGTRLDTIPAGDPYLSADPARVAQWEVRLGPRTLPRVGLVWSSGERPDQPELKSFNARRNIPLAMLAAFKGAPVEFHSLQKGQPAEGEFAALDQTSGAWDGPPIADWAAELKDFAETAALMQALDLIVSVDTSTAHLAGALGRPVWIPTRFDACWRWLHDRADSPWYPTVRLFRQRAGGDWAPVLADIRAALETL